MISGNIITPADLDAAARAAWRRVDHDPSPMGKWRELLAFYRQVRHLPAAWTWSYYVQCLPRLSSLVLHPYILHGPIEDWTDTLALLDTGDSSRAEALSVALRKTARNFAQLGLLRELHILLHHRGLVQRQVLEDEWVHRIDAENAPIDAFRAYLSVVGRDDAPAFLDESLREWEQLRTGVVTILLYGMDTPRCTGLPLTLGIQIRRATEDAIIFDSPLADDGARTSFQLERAVLLARSFVSAHERQSPPPAEVSFRYDVRATSFFGGSLGLAAAVSAVEGLSALVNGSLRWVGRPATAFIGELDEFGTIEEGRWEHLAPKLEAAFYSPVDRIVLPRAHLSRALDALAPLLARHPRRALRVIGASQLSEVLDNDELVQVRHRTVWDRSGEFVRTHQTPLLLGLLVLILTATGHFAYRSIFADSPREFVPLSHIGANALVYNPHDTAIWSFRDHERICDPTMHFGSTCVGDSLIHVLWVWNLSGEDREVNLTLEGPHSKDWTLLSPEGPRLLSHATPVRLPVRFLPRHVDRHASMDLVIRDRTRGTELFRLRLTAIASPS